MEKTARWNFLKLWQIMYLDITIPWCKFKKIEWWENFKVTQVYHLKPNIICSIEISNMFLNLFIDNLRWPHPFYGSGVLGASGLLVYYIHFILRLLYWSSQIGYYFAIYGHWPIYKSEWLLVYANSAIFQLYHGKNKLIFHEMMMRSTLY